MLVYTRLLIDVPIFYPIIVKNGLILSLRVSVNELESKACIGKVRAMSKKQYKSQASSNRALLGNFTTQNDLSGSSASFGTVSPSSLSYVYEPPDLRAISEPKVVVAYKNVQKRDSTTKARALEDLQAYILALTSEKGDLEDSVLRAWVGFLATS